jgi:hypothetical protein
VSFEDDAADEEMALGNIEVGGVYVVPVNRVAFVLRAGLTLPTASDGLAEFITNVLAVRPRGTDAVTVTPQSLWLRSAASVVGRSGQFFFRGDLGLDLPLIDEYEIDLAIGDLAVDLDPLVRFNAGAGVIAGPTAIMLELVTIANTGDDPDNPDPDADDDDFESNLALGARYIRGSVHPSLSLVFALDEAARDVIDFMVVAGVQGIIGGP